MKELKDTLWKAADKLRGSLSAHQYKDVILGLVFLKYVSDAYDERREQIRAEIHNGVLDLTIPKRAEAQPKKITVTKHEGRGSKGKA